MTRDEAVEVIEICAGCDWDCNDQTKLPDPHAAIAEWRRQGDDVLPIVQAFMTLGDVEAARAYMSWWLGAMRRKELAS